MVLSKTSRYIIKAHNAGYRVINQIIYNPQGRILNGHTDGRGYKVFRPYHKSPAIPVHRLVAYQKYGHKIFAEGIQVRHLDDVKINNSDGNIGIGTRFDNMQDIPKAERVRKAIIASSANRKFNDADMNKIRKDYARLKSYKRVMEMWKISSKATLHRILNVNYATRV